MMIMVNGREREVEDGITVAQLLSELNIDIKNVAVELNLKILGRSEYESVELKENDRVEVVLPVGGGDR